MDKKTHLVCVICCKSFRNKDGAKDKSVKCLQQFCEEILVEGGGGEGGGDLRERFGFMWGEGSGLVTKWWKKGSSGGGGVRRRGRGRKKKGVKVTGEDLGEEGSSASEVGGNREIVRSLEEKLGKFLDNPGDNLGICGKCLEVMGKMTEARLSAKVVEERVEKLQMLILREMGRLQRKMDVVWREFGRMEEVKNGGDRLFMENCLDHSYKRPGKGKLGKQKVFGRISDEHWERKEEIWGFRGKISEVFRELDKYHEDIKDKFTITGRINEVFQKKKSEECVVVKEEPLENLQDNQEEDSYSHNYFREDDPADNLEDNLTGSLGDHGDANFGDDFNDGDGEPMDIDEYIQDLYENEGDDDDNHSDDGNDSNKQSRLLEEDEDDKEEEEGDDPSDDDDYTPISRTRRYEAVLTDYEWHLQKLSPFKRAIVESVLKVQQRHENKKLENKNKSRSKILEAEALLTPYQRYMAKLSYHLESQTIYLSGIPIKIQCKEDNEPGDGMLCLKCNFKTDDSADDVETQMYDHVLSKHLNAYQCPHCGDDNQLETDKEYRKHVRICRESQNCDICGKPFSSGRGLKTHKWSHMNEEEKKEAIENGEKEPRILNLKAYPRKYQCQKCGKSYKFLAQLKSHEEVHLDRSEREQFVCPKCGKSFLKQGYEYHVKWSDSCAEEPVERRVQCLQCSSTFKNKARLRHHVIMVHTEKGRERPFVCEICGKGYRSKAMLKEHGRLHTGERHRCEGCGAGFTRYSNLKRHEKTCAK